MSGWKDRRFLGEELEWWAVFGGFFGSWFLFIALAGITGWMWLSMIHLAVFGVALVLALFAATQDIFR